MIRYLSTKVVVVSAALYLLFDILWLLAANSRGISDPSRPILKTLCITAAAIVYVVTASVLATQAGDRWAMRTSVSSGVALLVGLFLITIVSWLGWRGQLFHDAEPLSQVPSLVALLIAVSLMGAVVAYALGALARVVWRVPTAGG